MPDYSREDEIKDLHDITKEMFAPVFRDPDVKARAQEIEAATACAQLARLQAELQAG